MTPTVVVDISISVDGFVARPDDSPGPIHEWFFGGGEVGAADRGRVAERFDPAGASKQVLEENLTRPGAIVSGRRTYDVAGGWGGSHPGGVPVVVVTSSPPEPSDVPSGSTEIHFAPDVGAAIETALEIAADSEEIQIMGGPSVIAQALELGSVDELQVHVTPALLGSGQRLIEHLGSEVRLEQVRVVEAPDVTHLRYRVR